MGSVRIVLLTDTHLFGEPDGDLRGVATLPALEAVLARAAADIAGSRLVLVTGDLVQDDPGGYAPLRRALERLGRPVACIPGNHDVPAELHRALHGAPFTTRGCLDLGDWRIALVDSTQPGSAAGRVSVAELQALERALASAGSRHVLVCLHHQPVPMGSRWLDEVGLENAAAFFAVVDRHPCVRGIAWGHVHQALEGQRAGVRLLATPSTCAQFAPGLDDFAVDSRPPAYRMLELLPDGGIVTEVVWVDLGNTRGGAAH